MAMSASSGFSSPVSACRSSFYSPSRHPSLPAPPAAASPRARRGAAAPPRVVVAAGSGGDAHGADSGGRLVDEDMIVLRKRLHELRAAEEGREPPAHWMEWERRYYAGGYNADVCQFAGLLQALLLNTRPSVALGLLALVALSVPVSAGVVVLNLVDAMNAHLGGLLGLG